MPSFTAEPATHSAEPATHSAGIFQFSYFLDKYSKSSLVRTSARYFVYGNRHSALLVDYWSNLRKPNSDVDMQRQPICRRFFFGDLGGILGGIFGGNFCWVGPPRGQVLTIGNSWGIATSRDNYSAPTLSRWERTTTLLSRAKRGENKLLIRAKRRELFLFDRTNVPRLFFSKYLSREAPIFFKHP